MQKAICGPVTLTKHPIADPKLRHPGLQNCALNVQSGANGTHGLVGMSYVL